MQNWMLLILGVTACGKASAGTSEVADEAAAFGAGLYNYTNAGVTLIGTRVLSPHLLTEP